MGSTSAHAVVWTSQAKHRPRTLKKWTSPSCMRAVGRSTARPYFFVPALRLAGLPRFPGTSHFKAVLQEPPSHPVVQLILHPVLQPPAWQVLKQAPHWTPPAQDLAASLQKCSQAPAQGSSREPAPRTVPFENSALTWLLARAGFALVLRVDAAGFLAMGALYTPRTGRRHSPAQRAGARLLVRVGQVERLAALAAVDAVPRCGFYLRRISCWIVSSNLSRFSRIRLSFSGSRGSAFSR